MKALTNLGAIMKPHERIINSYQQDRKFTNEDGETINYKALVLVFDVNGKPVAITTSIKKYDQLVLDVAKDPSTSKLEDSVTVESPNTAT